MDGLRREKTVCPSGDRDAPAECDKDGYDTAVSCDCDARWKCGYDGHYSDGETVAMTEIRPPDGRAFIQRETDPYTYIDGDDDDVRDPKTGDIHLAFITILEHLGATYIDISQSGVGVHAVCRGDFPMISAMSSRLPGDSTRIRGGRTKIFRVLRSTQEIGCVSQPASTSPRTPVEINDWNESVLEYLLEANDQLPRSTRSGDPNDIPNDRDDHDFEYYQPETTRSDEITTDIRNISTAIDCLDAQRVARKTIVQRWNDDTTTPNSKRAF